jgi:hypothetical protein
MENNDLILENMARDLIEFNKEADRLIEINQEMVNKYNYKIEVLKEEKEKRYLNLEAQVRASIKFEQLQGTKTQTVYKIPSAKIVLKKAYQTMKIKGNINIEEVNKKYIKTVQSIDWATWKKDLTINNDGNIIYKDNKKMANQIEFEDKPENLIIKLIDD